MSSYLLGGAQCAHCALPVTATEPGVVRQWRLFVLPHPYAPMLACSAACEGVTRRMAHVMAAEAGERDDVARNRR